MIKKEFKKGDIAYIGRNIRVKFLVGNDIKVKTLKCDTEVTIVGHEKIADKYGKYGYFIEFKDSDILMKSTHTISQFDFYSKYQWETKIKQEELIRKLLEKED